MLVFQRLLVYEGAAYGPSSDVDGIRTKPATIRSMAHGVFCTNRIGCSNFISRITCVLECPVYQVHTSTFLLAREVDALGICDPLLLLAEEAMLQYHTHMEQGPQPQPIVSLSAPAQSDFAF